MTLGWVGRSKIELRSGDELTYLSLSHAIEQGSYREVYRPSAPRHIKYPPGYPAWLVLARGLVGQQVAWIPAVNLLLVATALAVLFVITRGLVGHWQGGWLAVALLLPLCVNRGLIRLGSSYYSEALFILLCTLTLAAAYRADKGSRTWSYVAILLAEATFMTRTAGIAMVAAIGLWLLCTTRRSREWLFFGVASAVTVGGWFAYVWQVQAAQPTTRSYAFDFGINPGRVPPSDRLGLLERLSTAFHDYSLYAVPIDFSLRTGFEPTLYSLPWLLLLYVGVPVGLWMLWHRWRAAALFVLCYGLVVLAFPYRDNRLVVPALPFLLLASMLGMWGLTSRLADRLRTAGRAAFVGGFVLMGAFGTNRFVQRARVCDREQPYDRATCYDRETRDLVAGARYLAARTPVDASALAWRATSVAFLSNRRVESAIIVSQTTPAGFGALVRQSAIRYVLLTPMHHFEKRELADALIASCADFTVESRLPAGSLLLATRAAPDSSANACDALATFRQLHTR